MSGAKRQTGSGATEGNVSAQQLADRIERLRAVDRPRFQRLLDYCQNPMRVLGGGAGTESAQDRPYRQAQEWGMPTRITGSRGPNDTDPAARKEVVIENDIGWRIDTMVDYLFGRPMVVSSAAPDSARRAEIGELLRQVLAFNGGILLFQQLALLGSVYGFVDVLVKLDTDAACAPDATSRVIPHDSTACGTQELGQPPAGQESRPDGSLPSDGREAGDGSAPSHAESASGAEDEPTSSADASPIRAARDQTSHAAIAARPSWSLARLARMVRLEVVEPARALPFLCPSDWRRIEAYGQVLDPCDPTSMERFREEASGRRTWIDLLRRLASPRNFVNGASHDPQCAVEVITSTRWRRYENGKIVADGENSLGRVPLVHIQNTAVPFAYAGASDVEPLIPLQDELNTRLSDRANRITLQSFKMYLGKNIDNFDTLPIAPGRMWVSDEKDADVIEFGGDASCPSEDAHISDIREALDKTSGVTPIAAGAVQGRIGNLTSAVALRVTLQALLAKTEKKRTTYGTAVQEMCELALAWLDRAGLFRTTPEERRVELNWPSPIPENESEKLQEAEAKVRLGVPKEIVLKELGY